MIVRLHFGQQVPVAEDVERQMAVALGVYHGLRRKHIQSHLDEFVFRFDRRKTRYAAFKSLLGIAVEKPPVTYNMLIKPEGTG